MGKNLVDWFREAQPAIIEGLTLIAPYSAAALPAALTGGHVAMYILPPEWGLWGVPVYVSAGVALESIGIATGWTIANIITKTRSVPYKNNWRLHWAIYAAAHYVIAAVATNVLLVAIGPNPVTKFVSVAALSTIGVPAIIIGVLAALDADEQKQAKEKKEEAKSEAKELRAERREDRQQERRDNLAARVRIAEIKAQAAAPAPAPQPAQVDSQAPVNESIAAQVAELTAQGKSKKEIALILTAQGVQGKDIAAALGVDPAQVSRWKNGVKA